MIGSDDLYFYELPTILENFHYEYYLSLSGINGQIVFLNIAEFLQSNFTQHKSEYANKEIHQRLYVSIHK